VLHAPLTVNGVYTYDLAGNRLSALYLGNTVRIDYTYDALNRLTGIAENGRASAHGYDAAGNLVRKTLPNGDVESMLYDAAKRMSWEASDSGAGERQYGYTYHHDLAGNLTGIEESNLAPYNQAQTFLYDGNHRLTDETSTAFGAKHYTYDDGNNRTSFTDPSTGAVVSCSYNALNQIVSLSENGSGAKSVTYGYDFNGNRVSRTSAGVINVYSYDGENRLTGVTTGSDGKDYAYSYDYRSRRVERVENGLSTKVIFSGGLSIQEYSTISSPAARLVEYIRGHEMGGGVGGILYSNRGTVQAPQLSYDHYNIRGDVVATTAASGAKTWQGWYDAFGTHTHTSGTPPIDRQRANTKEEDPTGLLNEGFRYRDLETGVFITKDPLGFVNGPNVYTYVKQNPWTAFDPEGLELQWVAQPGASEDSVKQAKQLWDKAITRRLPNGAKPEFVKRMEDVETNKSKNTVQIGSEGNAAAPSSRPDSSDPKKGSPGTVQFNPDKKGDMQGVERNPESSLVHEVAGHVYEYNKGIAGSSREEREKSATAVENEQRSTAGLPQREKYGDWPVKKFTPPTQQNNPAPQPSPPTAQTQSQQKPEKPVPVPTPVPKSK